MQEWYFRWRVLDEKKQKTFESRNFRTENNLILFFYSNPKSNFLFGIWNKKHIFQKNHRLRECVRILFQTICLSNKVFLSKICNKYKFAKSNGNNKSKYQKHNLKIHFFFKKKKAIQKLYYKHNNHSQSEIKNQTFKYKNFTQKTNQIKLQRKNMRTI